MATTNNLGRVQGISLWVADGVVTTTGTITLTNSTMHPLINDNVVDTNGNVFKITAVSGTNPYTITTSGTPIYRITSDYNLPIASTTQLGGVKVGNGINVDGSGVISISSSGALKLFKSRSGVVGLSQTPVILPDALANILEEVYQNIKAGKMYVACIQYAPYSDIVRYSTSMFQFQNNSDICYLFMLNNNTTPFYVSYFKRDLDRTNKWTITQIRTTGNTEFYIQIYEYSETFTNSNILAYSNFIRLENEEDVYQTDDFDTMLDNLINKPSETIIYINNIGYAYFETTDNNLYNNSVEIINEEEQTKTTYTCSLNKTDKTIKITSNVEPYIKEEE